MKKNLPAALDDLNNNDRKTTHWAWWAFPTKKGGDSEPVESNEQKSYVTETTAIYVIQHAPLIWRTVLEKVCSLLNDIKNSNNIIPVIDHSRLQYFVQFWESIIRDNPDGVWLQPICEVLRTHYAIP